MSADHILLELPLTAAQRAGLASGIYKVQGLITETLKGQTVKWIQPSSVGEPLRTTMSAGPMLLGIAQLAMQAAMMRQLDAIRRDLVTAITEIRGVAREVNAMHTHVLLQPLDHLQVAAEWCARAEHADDPRQPLSHARESLVQCTAAMTRWLNESATETLLNRTEVTARHVDGLCRAAILEAAILTALEAPRTVRVLPLQRAGEVLQHLSERALRYDPIRDLATDTEAFRAMRNRSKVRTLSETFERQLIVGTSVLLTEQPTIVALEGVDCAAFLVPPGAASRWRQLTLR